ncbi:Ger(x)C family spore germination protein [Clostridium sp. JN-1]|uniref:Ger(x)C family spore germination protein n=1 Tax=Clostridium sp. JN-1 TaxID=2483110 RepID=UPI000F0B08D8|nr:Ger(x)C family spore germination protein [Clostridium sp. JN-1]
MKKYVKIIILIMISLSLTSCWDARELNKLAIVMGIGIDKIDNLSNVQTTIQIAKVLGIKSPAENAEGVGQNNKFLNLKGEGITIFDAIKSINRELNRTLFFPHNQVIIFGKSAAEEGIDKYIDFFMRNRETRLSEWIIVSDGTAAEILKSNPNIESTTGRNIGELIENQKNISEVPNVDLKEFSQKLMSKTTAPVAPIIKVGKDEKRNTLYLTSTAVFNKEKMIGVLNKTETRGFLWGTGNMNGEVSIINMPDGNGKVSIEIRNVKSKIIPAVKSDGVYITMKIDERGDISENTSSEDESNPEIIKKFERIQEDVIKKEVISTLEKARQINADVFGFGDIIYMYHPKEWNKMQTNWQENFKNIKVNVNVKASIERSGKIIKSIKSKDI